MPPLMWMNAYSWVLQPAARLMLKNCQSLPDPSMTHPGMLGALNATVTCSYKIHPLVALPGHQSDTEQEQTNSKDSLPDDQMRLGALFHNARKFCTSNIYGSSMKVAHVTTPVEFWVCFRLCEALLLDPMELNFFQSMPVSPARTIAVSQ